MKLTCSNKSCHLPTRLRKDGHYFRKSDSKYIQRYRCIHCGQRLSSARLSKCFGQKKRTINAMVEKLYCSKVSIRRIAKIIGVDKKTVMRKIIFLGQQAAVFNQEFLQKVKLKPAEHVQLDDLISKEKTKMLPVSISVICDADTRRILGFEVSQIPAFGHLAKRSRKKYGYRQSQHMQKLDILLAKTRSLIADTALMRSDEHQFYPELIKKHYPDGVHQRFKGGRACIAGQGELKKISRDPLFAINHTFAMMRDNLSRLVRRSWCVTQEIPMLEHHLHIYMKFHNTQLV
jgi:transposase-like protein/IS1 family transposase